MLDERETKKGTYDRYDKSFEHEEILSEVISQEVAGASMPMDGSPEGKMP